MFTMERPKFRTLASAGESSPQEMKREVKQSESVEVIYYHGEVYAVRWEELRNLGLDHYGSVLKECQRRGLGDPVFFGRACHYCDKAGFNIADMFAEGREEPVIVQDTSKIDWKCQYVGDPEIKEAVSFTPKTGTHKGNPIYAIHPDRCAFNDSLVSVLAQGGHLEPYKTDMKFNFQPITDFPTSDSVPDEFLAENVFPQKPGIVSQHRILETKTLWQKITDFLRR